MSPRRIALVSFSIVALATGLAASAQPAAPAKNPFRGVNFVSNCRFSHRAPDDPIVFPGKPGLSHDHSFVGNNSTNAFSTLDSLRAGTTTCRRPGDKAGYWMPTVLQNGNPVLPLGATIYYRRATFAQVEPFPAGLKIIAGDSHATAPQLLKIVYWNCGVETGLPPQSMVPTCPSGSMLRLHVRFPNCWDGKNLESVDHKMHMAYSEAGHCPADHPVAVPAIEVIFRYPIQGGADVVVASGGQLSGHADFFNAWDQATLTSLVNGCLNALRHCGARLS